MRAPRRDAYGCAPSASLASGEAAQSQPEGVALGKTAKSVDQNSQNAIGVIANSPAWKAANADRQARRTQKLNHQRTAAKLLPGSRTANCLWAVASNAAGVDVIHNMDDARSQFSGLQTCGSVWACPCCSHTISDSRRQNSTICWPGHVRRDTSLCSCL